jgi:hypothetical protein
MISREFQTVAVIVVLLVLSACSSLNQASSEGDLKAVKDLISGGADIDRKGEHGDTPLIAATKQDNIEVIKLLLVNGADPSKKNDFGKSALWYAYANESFNAFKLLLEYGGIPDFDYSKEKLTSRQKKLLALGKEHRWYTRIKEKGENTKIALFDRYFELFPNGFYKPEVEDILEETVKSDYKKMAASGSPFEMEAFLRKYAVLGPKRYEVTVRGLNIRAGSSLTDERVGSYRKGDVIEARERSNGWIRTDRGWVHGDYVRLLPTDNPIVKPYVLRVYEEYRESRMELATLKIDTRDKPAGTSSRRKNKPDHKPKTNKTRIARTRLNEKKMELVEPDNLSASPVSGEKKNRSARPAPAPSRKTESRKDRVRNEFETVMEGGKLPELAAFIEKYRGEEKYRELVEKAKSKYLSIIMSR